MSIWFLTWIYYSCSTSTQQNCFIQRRLTSIASIHIQTLQAARFTINRSTSVHRWWCRVWRFWSTSFWGFCVNLYKFISKNGSTSSSRTISYRGCCMCRQWLWCHRFSTVDGSLITIFRLRPSPSFCHGSIYCCFFNDSTKSVAVQSRKFFPMHQSNILDFIIFFFFAGWHLRGYVFGDLTNFDQSAISIFNSDYCIRFGLLHRFVEVKGKWKMLPVMKWSKKWFKFLNFLLGFDLIASAKCAHSIKSVGIRHNPHVFGADVFNDARWNGLHWHICRTIFASWTTIANFVIWIAMWVYSPHTRETWRLISFNSCCDSATNRSIYDSHANSIDELADRFGCRWYWIGASKCPIEAFGNAGRFAHRIGTKITTNVARKSWQKWAHRVSKQSKV